uniref:CPG4 domain-containing protein n=1 Tax=Elaeophora elaphi TaxID=1147741 RepID=A0A0R3RSH0_9BILA
MQNTKFINPLITFVLFLLVLFLRCRVQCELIRQCTCDEIQNCRKQLLNFVKPCADKCQRYAHKAKANYAMLKNCVLQNEQKILRTISCTENIFYNACAARPGQFVQKTYIESLEIAGLTEIKRMLGRYERSLQPLITIGRRFLRCAGDCINRSSKYCYDRLECGLDLPDTSVMVQRAKQCAISSGFNRETVQQMCYCATSAGIRDLRDVCPRLQIT